MAALLIAFALFARTPVAGDDEVHATTFTGLTRDFEIDAAPDGDFLRRFKERRIATVEVERAAVANRAMLDQLLALFADTDERLRARRHREVIIEGPRDPREVAALLSLTLAAAEVARASGRAAEAARHMLAGLHAAERLHSGRGVEGAAAMLDYGEALLPWLPVFLAKSMLPPDALDRFRAYLDWFARDALQPARIYDEERLRALARFFPMYRDDVDREMYSDRRVEELFPDLLQNDAFFAYKEAEALILRLHRHTRLPFARRLARFKEVDAERKGNRAVARHLPFQAPFMARLERAAMRLELAGLAAACVAHRARHGRFPADAKEMAAAGIAVPRDRFADPPAPVHAVGKGGLLVLYSVGMNGIDDIFTRDDLVFRLVAE